MIYKTYEEYKKRMKVVGYLCRCRCVEVYNKNDELIYTFREGINKGLEDNNIPIQIKMSTKDKPLYESTPNNQISRLKREGKLKFKGWYLVDIKQTEEILEELSKLRKAKNYFEPIVESNRAKERYRLSCKEDLKRIQYSGLDNDYIYYELLVTSIKFGYTFIKIGITNRSIAKRYSSYFKSFKFEVLTEEFLSKETAKMKEKLYKYDVNNKRFIFPDESNEFHQSGKTECFITYSSVVQERKIKEKE